MQIFMPKIQRNTGLARKFARPTLTNASPSVVLLGKYEFHAGIAQW